jgi:hypothetical protein
VSVPGGSHVAEFERALAVNPRRREGSQTMAKKMKAAKKKAGKKR